MSNKATLTQQGIAALKVGDKPTAYNLLSTAVRQEPNNQLAWIWLSGATLSAEEIKLCLEKVIAINPNNELGRKAASGLRHIQFLSEFNSQNKSTMSPEKTNPSDTSISSITSITESTQVSDAQPSIPPTIKIQALSGRKLVNVVSFLVIVFCMGIIFLWPTRSPSAPVHEITAIPATASVGLGLSVADITAKFPDYSVEPLTSAKGIGMAAPNKMVTIFLTGNEQNLDHILIVVDITKTLTPTIILKDTLYTIEPGLLTFIDIAYFVKTDPCLDIKHDPTVIQEYSHKYVSMWCSSSIYAINIFAK